MMHTRFYHVHHSWQDTWIIAALPETGLTTTDAYFPSMMMLTELDSQIEIQIYGELLVISFIEQSTHTQKVVVH